LQKFKEIKKTSDKGYSKFKEYEEGYTAQIIGKTEDLDPQTQEYLRDVSSDRADREYRKKFVKTCYLSGVSDAEKTQ